ncbi:MAG TPA: lyase family protein, partial [Thermomicrobiales bacterium]|nr:lyase family protein [Thermomicrobiales bacterium]
VSGLAALSRVSAQVDGAIPAGFRGVATLGLAREEWGATVERMGWRFTALEVGAAISRLMGRLVELARAHAVTIMPAYAVGRLVQPTTLAHYLGGVIEPLRSQRQRLREGFERLNRSPLGSGSLVGGALDPDRVALAQRLGFEGPIHNTFAAVSTPDDIVELVDLAASSLTSVERFVVDVLAWHRTDPTSFLVDERWLTRPEPAQPVLEVPSRLDNLAGRLQYTAAWLDGSRREFGAVPYGPVSTRRGSSIERASEVARQIVGVLDETTAFIAEGLIVNRAYLGNRAGRNLVTGGDLAFFLMAEEEIAPAAAIEITSLVLARLQDSNLEVSGITQDIIDAAALLTIGREVKVEMETLGRYLAPRRYLERRQVTGSAAPAMARKWLDTVEQANREEDGWLSGKVASIGRAYADLERTIQDAAGESPDD